MSVEMKDSGIAWIGEIPKHWEMLMLKNAVSIKRGGSPRPIEEYISDVGYNWIKIGDTTKGSKYIYSCQVKIKESGLSKTRKVQVDDLILTNSMSFGEPYILKIDGCIHDGWVVFSDYKNIDKEFLYYFLLSPFCKQQFDLQVAGGVVQNLNIDKIGTTLLLLPSLSEQQLIANFLDKKCAEIDELITLQEQMIAQLTTYKQAVITETVTKGLDPNVKMKDSGVEWIGEIPEHWDVCKIQYMANLKSGYNLTTEQITDEGLYPVYGGNGIRGFYHEFFNDGEYVLIGRQGALCGNINYSTGKFWATEHAVICYPKMQYATKWFGELLRSMNLNQYSLASAQPGLAVERIKALSIPLPPLSEQQSIANYLDQKCKEIDELISVKKEKIEKLKAYKKSVIYEYVTGKKQVSLFK